MRDDDRLYLPPARSSYPWLAAVLAIALIAGLGGYYYLREHQEKPAPAATAPAQTMIAPEPQPSPQPAIRYPLKAPQLEAPKLLPPLDDSDSMMRYSLADLMGRS